MPTGNFGRLFRFRSTIGAVLSAVVLAVALSACSHTKFMSTWRNPEYQGPPARMLVHVAGRSPTVRTMFENRLAEQLKRHGVAAFPGNEYLPQDLIIDRNAVNRVVDEKRIDAVFIAGPTNRKDLESLRSGEASYAGGLYEGQVQDYDRFSAFVSGSVYSSGTYAGGKVSVEMALYDVKTKKRIWSALSEAYLWDTPVDEIQPLVDRIMKMLEFIGVQWLAAFSFGTAVME